MSFENIKATNNAQVHFFGGVGASTTTFILRNGEGGLIANEFPTLGICEKYDTSGRVTRREVIKITGKSGDILTVVRAFEECPASFDSLSQTQTSFPFDDGDIITIGITAETLKQLSDELIRLENDKLNKSVYNLERQLFSASSTGNDSYKITSSDILVYNNGQTFKIQADVGNEGSATLELNTLGTKSLKKYKDGALVELETGDIVTNQIFWATYNSTANCFQFSIDPATVVIPNIKATKSIFTAGEDLVAGNLVCQPKYLVSTIQQLTGNNFDDGKDHSHGQTITVSGNILKDFTGYFWSAYTYNSNIQMQIYTSLGGTLLWTYTLSKSLTSGEAFSYKFSTNLNISSYSSLYVVFNFSGTYRVNNVLTTSNLYAGGVRYLDGVATTGDLKFEMTILSDGLGKIYKTDASNEYNLSVTGIVTNNISTGGLVTLDTSGISDTQTGLTTGSDYFLSNTPGAISTTPGTNVVSVGKAVNSTGIQLDIDRVKQLSVITPTVGASPYTYQNTTGRPVLVSITGGTVSQVAYSRDNTNFYQTSGVTNTFVYLGINDYVKVTYSVIPTLKTFTF